MSHEEIDEATAKCDEDRLALNRLRVKWNARHRRLCAEINKAAEDKLLDGWAAQSRAAHDLRLEQAARDRRSRRQRLTPGQRVDRALGSLGAMSTVPAAITPDPNLKDVKIPKYATSQEPGTVAGLGLVDVSPILAGITFLVEQLEAVLDAQKGLIPPHELAKLPGAVKDTYILTRLRGMRSEDIAAAMPWLGGKRTIEILRREHGQRPVDGTDRVSTPQREPEPVAA
jgi:hypothetical protein